MSRQDLAGIAFLLAMLGGSIGGFVLGGSVGALIGFFVPFVGGSALTHRAARGFNEAHNVAVAQLESGDIDDAITRFEALATRHRLHHHRLPLLFNLGIAEARRGHLEDALMLWSSVWQSRAIRSQPPIRAYLPLLMADAYARLGDVFAARAWLGVVGVAGPAARPVVACVEALIFLRDGRYDEAEAVYVAAWSSLENALQGRQLRDARVLRAFGAQARGAPVEALLAPLQPTTPGRAAHLATSWPALASFIVEQRL